MSKRKSPRLWGFASGALAAGALLIGLPTAATATEPATTAEARQMAQDSMLRAEQNRQVGGAAYKAGLVQRDEADAARYTALADQMEGTAPVPVTSPEADHFAALAAHYRFVGGAGYKTGLVQSAEAAQRDAQAAVEPAAVTPAPEQPNPICIADKPVVMPACLSE